MGRLLAQGRSLSGRERHCCFLNTGGSRFADVSAALGLDLPDDGRAIAVVDWDQDGDLDFWISNRNAPSIRFLRNDLDAGNHFLDVRLIGESCNRDAIGTRVEVHLSDPSQTKLIKSLRAGDGFLGQSSKWLHFGLGQAKVVDRLIVHWPGSTAEEFSGLAANKRYHIVQGRGKEVLWTYRNPRKVELTPSQPEKPPSIERARIVLLTRVPVLELDYRDFDGSTVSVDRKRQQPLLINLWASWCASCVEELNEFSQRADEIRAHGLDIVALSVDGLNGDDQDGSVDPEQLLAQIGFDFSTGHATEGTLTALEEIQQQVSSQIRPIAIPTSFLIDTYKNVAVMYKGPLDVDQLLEDLDLLDAPSNQLRDAAVLSPGRWARPVAEVPEIQVTFDHYFTVLLGQPRNIGLLVVVLLLIGVLLYRTRAKKVLSDICSQDVKVE